MAALQLTGLAKRYAGGSTAVHQVDLRVEDGEFMVLVGPSGCGKSTTLRMIAGLEEPSDGQILIGSQDVTDAPPAQRGVAMVFQSYALYPHMTVAENMGFGLKMSGMPAGRIEAKVDEAARVLQLDTLLKRKPKELSGGQRQRVAIGRAIVREPAVFLFDEPLSNLDAALRTQMRMELARLHQSLNATIVYVTHDQVEAMTLGDRIAIFNAGRIEQVGKPLELYRHPVNRFVAGFLGSPRMNFLPVRPLVAPNGSQGLELGPEGPIWPLAAPIGRIEDAVEMGVRPEHLTLLDARAAEGLAAVIEHLEHLGDVLLAHCRLDGCEARLTVKAVASAGLSRAVGERVRIQAQPQAVLLFDAQGRTLAGSH